MTQDVILDVIHVMWETTKLLLLGMSMLVVMVIFMILIVLFVSYLFLTSYRTHVKKNEQCNILENLWN